MWEQKYIDQKNVYEHSERQVNNLKNVIVK